MLHRLLHHVGPSAEVVASPGSSDDGLGSRSYRHRGRDWLLVASLHLPLLLLRNGGLVIGRTEELARRSGEGPASPQEASLRFVSRGGREYLGETLDGEASAPTEHPPDLLP